MSEIKPCDMSCAKCGSDNVHRHFLAKGELMQTNEHGRSPSKYAEGEAYRYRVYREHIRHRCNICRYEWDTLPLKRAKKVTPSP